MNKQFFRNSTIGWAAICMMGLSLFGQGEPPEDGSDIPKPVRIMVRYLDMSPSQVAHFIELRQHLRECVAPRHERLKRLKAALKEALSQNPPSSELIGDLVIEIHAVKQEIRRCHAAYQQAFADMLDDEQLRKMEILTNRHSLTCWTTNSSGKWRYFRLRPGFGPSSTPSRRWDCWARLPTRQKRM